MKYNVIIVVVISIKLTSVEGLRKLEVMLSWHQNKKQSTVESMRKHIARHDPPLSGYPASQINV
jgi:hypothetical protein